MFHVPDFIDGPFYPPICYPENKKFNREITANRVGYFTRLSSNRCQFSCVLFMRARGMFRCDFAVRANIAFFHCDVTYGTSLSPTVIVLKCNLPPKSSFA